MQLLLADVCKEKTAIHLIDKTHVRSKRTENLTTADHKMLEWVWRGRESVDSGATCTWIGAVYRWNKYGILCRNVIACRRSFRHERSFIIQQMAHWLIFKCTCSVKIQIVIDESLPTALQCRFVSFYCLQIRKEAFLEYLIICLHCDQFLHRLYTV